MARTKPDASATTGYEAEFEAGLVDCTVALPKQQFHSMQIPSYPWFLSRWRQRRVEVLLTDARKLVGMADRTHHDLTRQDISHVAGTYRAWRGGANVYEGVVGYCKSASIEEPQGRGHVLTLGRCVGAEPPPDDRESFDAEMNRLVGELRAQQALTSELSGSTPPLPRTTTPWDSEVKKVMTVRKLIDRTERFPVHRCVVSVGCDQGRDDRSPTQDSTLAFATDPGVDLRDGRRGNPSGHLVVVTDEVDSSMILSGFVPQSHD